MWASSSHTIDHVTNAAQRGIHYLDVMRQREDAHREQRFKTAPNVLNYEFELLIDGRKRHHPVNYALVRVILPGTDRDPNKQPFVVVDPRGGHGLGIGGFAADSEVGAAFKAGHPCYLIGFLPDPVSGLVINDITRAKALFLEKVISLHPQAKEKPTVIGNCQAGWAILMLAAIRLSCLVP